MGIRGSVYLNLLQALFFCIKVYYAIGRRRSLADVLVRELFFPGGFQEKTEARLRHTNRNPMLVIMLYGEEK